MLQKLNKKKWKPEPLANIGKVISGSTPSTTIKEYWGGEINWFTPKDLSKNTTKYVSASPNKITGEGFKSCSTAMLPTNSILFTSRAPIGHIAISTIECCTNQGFKSIIPFEKTNSEYLYYALKYFTPNLQELGNGATFKELSKSTFEKFQIPLPPLPIQKQIADLLDTADALKKKNLAIMKHYDELANAIFMDMFGDPIKNEKGWEKKKLDFFGNWRSGGTPSRSVSSFFKGKIPWLSSGELNDIFIDSAKEKITELAIEKSNTKIIEIGSILLGMYDTAALKSSITLKEVCCNQAIAYAKLNDEKCNTLYVYFTIQFCKEHFKIKQRGVRQKNLNLSLIKSIEIIAPPVHLQNQFAEKIKLIEAQKELAKKSLLESENLFNGLMQEVFG
jgi:type I restriction enzyme, S subunit